MKKKPGVFRLALVLIVVMVLAGCSSNNGDSGGGTPAGSGESGGGSSGTASESASNRGSDSGDNNENMIVEPVNITFWYAISGANGEKFKELVDRFNASQELITVEATYSGSYADTAQKMMAALASKTEPNGALMAAGPLYTGPQNNTSILEMIRQDESFNMDDIYEGMWEYSKYNDEIVAIPYNISTPVLYYNKTIIEAAGIDANQPPATWDELVTMAKKAQADGNVSKSSEFWGFDTSDAPWTFKGILMQNGNNLIEVQDGNITPLFENTNGVEAAQFWRKLVDEGVMPAGQHDLAEKRFLSGNLAMIVSSSARMSRWSADPQIEFGAFPLPAMKKSAVPLGGGMLVQFNKSQAEDRATYELIKFLTSPEISTEFALSTSYLPIRKSALELPEVKKEIEANPMYKVAFDQLENSWAYWNFDQMGSMDFMIYDALEKVEKGIESPADAMANLSKNLIAEMKGN